MSWLSKLIPAPRKIAIWLRAKVRQHAPELLEVWDTIGHWRGKRPPPPHEIRDKTT